MTTPPPTRAEICKRLRELADEMIELGVDMGYYSLSPISQHGKELIGASDIARGWADGIEEEDKG